MRFAANRFRCRIARSGAPIVSATDHLAVGGDVFDVYRLSEQSRAGVDRRRQRQRRRRGGAHRLHQVHDPRDRSAAERARRRSSQSSTSPFPKRSEIRISSFRCSSACSIRTTFQLAVRQRGARLRLPAAPRWREPAGGDRARCSGSWRSRFEPSTIDLSPATCSCSTTDGLTEVRNRAGKQLLGSGAMEIIAHAGPHAQATRRRAGSARARARRQPPARRSGDPRDTHRRRGARRCVRARCRTARSLAGGRARPALADCKVHRGDRVVLYSTTRRSFGADLGFACATARVSCGIVRRGAGDAAARHAGRAGNARKRDLVRRRFRRLAASSTRPTMRSAS